MRKRTRIYNWPCSFCFSLVILNILWIRRSSDYIAQTNSTFGELSNVYKIFLMSVCVCALVKLIQTFLWICSRSGGMSFFKVNISIFVCKRRRRDVQMLNFIYIYNIHIHSSPFGLVGNQTFILLENGSILEENRNSIINKCG